MRKRIGGKALIVLGWALIVGFIVLVPFFVTRSGWRPGIGGFSVALALPLSILSFQFVRLGRRIREGADHPDATQRKGSAARRSGSWGSGSPN
jgi:hypothetical protein